MEIHSVLPDERARDENNNFLPWGYRYLDSSKNPRQPPEETGPFGRHRSTSRYSGSYRASRTRTGTTPIRKVEDPTVAEFSRLFSTQQKEEEELRAKNTLPNTSTADQPTPRLPSEPTPAQECLLYGYPSKAVEWKVISKYEKISNGHICEDYSRTDPDILNHRTSVVVPPSPLSKDALRKSRTYRGGQHWIKVTFDTYQSAERASFYSPQEIDGHIIFCEMWAGRGPFTDQPLLKGSDAANEITRNTSSRLRTLTTSQSTNLLSAQDLATRSKTLPRSHTLPDVQYLAPTTSQDDSSIISASTATASSATATAPESHSTAFRSSTSTSALRSRSVPSLPLTNHPDPTTPAQTLNPLTPTTYKPDFMTAIPTVRRTPLRPISEALAPQPTLPERILRSIPLVNLFFGKDRSATGGEIIGSGPVVDEEGKFVREKNGWYWGFWFGVDEFVGTDFCGIRGED